MNNPKLQKDIENFENAYKQVSLSVSEKENLKSNIFGRITPVAQPSPFFAWSFYLRAVPAALIMFAIIGAPVSFAAERSLPGDVLYKVKTNINEEVKAAFVPKEEKNEYYQSLLTKRVSEIKILAREGEIKKDALVDFEEALEENVSDVILALEVSEDSEEDTLEDHQVVVAALDISEDVLGLSEETGELDASVSFSIISEIETKEEVDDKDIDEKKAEDEQVELVELKEETEKENDKKEMREKFRSLRNVALDALSKHVEDISNTRVEEVESLVDDIVLEAKEEILGSDFTNASTTLDSSVRIRLEQEVEFLVNESVELDSDL
ncbi:MAG: hypothetical protein WC087_01120 [Candidatus Paceibacterota bacterium]